MQQTRDRPADEARRPDPPSSYPTSRGNQEHAVMIDDPVLIHDWHPVAAAADLPAGKPLGVRLLGEDVVLWRAGSTVLAWQDLCIHRGTRLSLGRIAGDTIECPYHGWTYGTDGRCVAIPAHPDQRPPAK